MIKMQSLRRGVRENIHFLDLDLNKGPPVRYLDALPTDDLLRLDGIKSLDIHLKAVGSISYFSRFS